LHDEFEKLTQKNDAASQKRSQELLQEVIRVIEDAIKTEKSVADLAHRWRNLIETVNFVNKNVYFFSIIW
jgi:K+/H+ antiporter YhaU regulatory subunit KhtT